MAGRGRPSKRSRLTSLAGIPGVTSTALSEILKTVQALPPGTDLNVSRKTVDRIYSDFASEVGLHLEIFELEPGPAFNSGPFEWYTCTMQRVQQYFCAKSEPFRRAMETTFANYGSSLHCVLYCDGITPGALLKPDIRKKVTVFYLSYVEFGGLLAYSEFWLPVGLIRDSVLKQLPGGLSQIGRLVLRQAFLGNESVQTVGLVCPVGENGADEIVFLSLQSVLADEDALCAFWGLKGSSGTVPCGVQCCVVGKPKGNLRPLAAQGARLKDIACPNIDEIGQLTDEDVWGKVADIESSRHLNVRGTKNLYEANLQGLGLNDLPDGLLFERDLRPFVRPASVNTFDIMHILYSQGLVGYTMFLFLQETKWHHDVYYPEVEAYLKDAWCWHRLGTHASPSEVFNKTREKASHEAVKAGATELLTVYPAIRHWILVHPVLSKCKLIKKARDALLALFAVCDTIEEARRTFGEAMRPLANRMKTENQTFMVAFVAAFGRKAVRPKHHMLLHVPRQLLRDLLALTCWAAERKHQMVLQCLSPTDNTRDYERGSIGKLIAAQLRQLAQFKGASYLEHPEKELPGESLAVSKGMRFQTTPLKVGEVCFIGPQCWLIEACIRDKGDFGICGKQLEFEQTVTSTADVWTVPVAATGTVMLQQAHCVRPARLWKYEANRVLVVR